MSDKPGGGGGGPRRVVCGCGRELEVGIEQAGTPVQCPACGRVVMVPTGVARLGRDTSDDWLTPQVRVGLGIAGAIGGGIVGSFAMVVDSAGNSTPAGCFGVVLGAFFGACWASSGFKFPGSRW